MPVQNTSPPVSLQARPGGVFTFAFEAREKGELYCDGKKNPVIFKKKYYALIGVNYFIKKKSYACVWKTKKSERVVAHVNVTPKEFKSEKLRVDKKKIDLSSKSLKRITEERALKNKVYSNSPPYPLFKNAFALPLDSAISSPYGSQRIFNNKRGHTTSA